jgi:hypothetical protein
MVFCSIAQPTGVVASTCCSVPPPWDLEVTNAGDVPFTEYLGGAVGRF